MSKSANVIRKLLERPYYIWKYLFQAVRVLCNYMLLGLQQRMQSNFRIGANPRVLSFYAFKAELPDARICVGDAIIVYHHCDILATGRGVVTVGKGCIIGSDFRLYCKETITLGDHVLISWNVLITDYDGHPVNPEERYEQMLYMNDSFLPSFGHHVMSPQIRPYQSVYATSPVAIGDNVWIGANATILKGVHIGAGSIVAAGAVVTKDVPARCIAAGNPAIIVKRMS